MQRIDVVTDPEEVQVLSNPIRLKILEALHEPASAAGVARAIGQTRQNANYHLKELERFGLVEKAGERRNGNFIESLYRARARTFMLSPRMTLGGAHRAEALASQVSLEQLVNMAEQLGRAAASLLDRAAFDGETIPSASVEANVRFASEDDREAFLNEYVKTVAALAKKYGKRRGESFKVVLAAYPDGMDERRGDV